MRLLIESPLPLSAMLWVFLWNLPFQFFVNWLCLNSLARAEPEILQKKKSNHPAPHTIPAYFIFYFFPSFISISDLQHQQCTPCCSHLTWSTTEFKEWVRQSEGLLSKQSALPRAHLILIGYLTDGRQEEGEKRVDGSLYVKDNSGAVPCEVHQQNNLMDYVLTTISERKPRLLESLNCLQKISKGQILFYMLGM